jgi:hypothetical protein
MYLNVRQPPLRSKFPFKPFSFLFPRISPSPSPVLTPSLSSSPNSTAGLRRSPSPQRMSKRSSSVPIAPIPPSLNPRGELIFSSRIDRSFRESYERYRAAFERRREERERAAYEATWSGWICNKILRIKHPAVFAPPPGTPVSTAGSGSTTPVARAGSVRGRGSAGSTPSSSRKSSPIPSRASRRTSLRSSVEPVNAGPLGVPEAIAENSGGEVNDKPEISPA